MFAAMALTFSSVALALNTPNCVSEPLPTAAVLPNYSAVIGSQATGGYRLALWRVPCAGAKPQILASFTPIFGARSKCTTPWFIVQDERWLSSTFRTQGAPFDPCGLTTTTTTLLTAEQGFDSERAFKLWTRDQDFFVYVSVPRYQLMPAPGQSLALRSTLSGNWYDPLRSGEGLNIEIGTLGDPTNFPLPHARPPVRNVLFASWFTYHQGAPRWLVGSVDFAEGASSASVPLYRGSGTGFGSQFNAAQVQLNLWGNATFEFQGCNSLRVNYTGSGEEGTLHLQRLLSGPTALDCQ